MQPRGFASHAHARYKFDFGSVVPFWQTGGHKVFDVESQPLRAHIKLNMVGSMGRLPSVLQIRFVFHDKRCVARAHEVQGVGRQLALLNVTSAASFIRNFALR
jgi:hypothetical protein